MNYRTFKFINIMKKLIFSLITLIAVWACTPQKEIGRQQADAGTVALDTAAFVLNIIDPEFERWYQMRYSPALDHSNDYYRSMNNLAVNNWNNYFMRGRFARVISSYISWSPAIDYGLDVNRKLNWYFRFIEERYRIRLFI